MNTTPNQSIPDPLEGILTGRKREAYSNRSICRKMEQEKSRLKNSREIHSISTFEPYMYLLKKEIYTLAKRANLTQGDHTVLHLMMSGCSCAEIARVLDISFSQARRLSLRVRRKLEKAGSDYPYSGLWQIYRRETAR